MTTMISELVIGISLFTPHLGYNDYNHNTPGIYALVNDSVIIGTVKNSYRRQSIYAAKTFKLKLGDLGTYDGALGAITNYPKHKILPLPTIGRTFGPVRAMFLPGCSFKSSSITFSMEYRFK